MQATICYVALFSLLFTSSAALKQGGKSRQRAYRSIRVSKAAKGSFSNRRLHGNHKLNPIKYFLDEDNELNYIKKNIRNYSSMHRMMGKKVSLSSSGSGSGSGNGSNSGSDSESGSGGNNDDSHGDDYDDNSYNDDSNHNDDYHDDAIISAYRVDDDFFHPSQEEDTSLYTVITTTNSSHIGSHPDQYVLSSTMKTIIWSAMIAGICLTMLSLFFVTYKKIEKKADPAKNYQAFEDDESTVSGFSRM